MPTGSNNDATPVQQSVSSPQPADAFQQNQPQVNGDGSPAGTCSPMSVGAGGGVSPTQQQILSPPVIIHHMVEQDHHSYRVAFKTEPDAAY